MVCVPCILIPVLLFIWHKFFQPILLRFWNPWEKKDKDGNVIKAGPEFPFQCKGDSCPFPTKKKAVEGDNSTIENADGSTEGNNANRVGEAEAVDSKKIN